MLADYVPSPKRLLWIGAFVIGIAVAILAAFRLEDPRPTLVGGIAVVFTGFALYRFAVSRIRPGAVAWLLLAGFLATELFTAYVLATQHVLIGNFAVSTGGFFYLMLVYTQSHILHEPDRDPFVRNASKIPSLEAKDR